MDGCMAWHGRSESEKRERKKIKRKRKSKFVISTPGRHRFDFLGVSKREETPAGKVRKGRVLVISCWIHVRVSFLLLDTYILRVGVDVWMIGSAGLLTRCWDRGEWMDS